MDEPDREEQITALSRRLRIPRAEAERLLENTEDSDE